MGAFVFRRDGNGGGALLYFDGYDLRPVPDPAVWESGDVPHHDWGRRSPGAARTALGLVAFCGCPDSLQETVAAWFYREWVQALPTEPQTIPEWVVKQEVVRRTMRAMNDVAGH